MLNWILKHCLTNFYMSIFLWEGTYSKLFEVPRKQNNLFQVNSVEYGRVKLVGLSDLPKRTCNSRAWCIATENLAALPIKAVPFTLSVTQKWHLPSQGRHLRETKCIFETPFTLMKKHVKSPIVVGRPQCHDRLIKRLEELLSL